METRDILGERLLLTNRETVVDRTLVVDCPPDLEKVLVGSGVFLAFSDAEFNQP